jgi:hypothetical protein
LSFSGLDKSLEPPVAVRIAILAAASEPSKANDRRHRRTMNSATLIARMLQTQKRTEIDGYGDPQDYSLKSDIWWRKKEAEGMGLILKK